MIVKVKLSDRAKVSIKIYDISGKIIAMPLNDNKASGTFEINVDLSDYKAGVYFATLSNNDQTVQTVKFLVSK